MDSADSSLHWLAEYGAWLPVVFFGSITLVLLMFNPTSARVRRSITYVLALAFFTVLFRYVPRDYRPIIPLCFLVIMFAAAFVIYSRRTLTQRKYGSLAPIMEAHRSGDYESILHLCDSLALRGTPVELFRASALCDLRRFDEAESRLRLALKKPRSLAMEGLLLDQLGQVLMEQGRNDDALACFQRAEALDPQRGAAFQGEAEIYLRGEYQLEKALQLARRAVELNRKQSSEMQAVCLSTSLAALAWALAANGRTSEARETVQEAFAQSQPQSVPRAAEDHYLAGKAMLAAGDQETAGQYFRKVAELDKKGNYGFLSRKELAALPAR